LRQPILCHLGNFCSLCLGQAGIGDVEKPLHTAELFVCRAENVSIFFADLFGYEEQFNLPGRVDAANWTLRLPGDFEALHARRLARGAAIDLGLAVDLALAAQEHGTERR